MPNERNLLIFEPSGLRISIEEGTSILDAARSLGLYISSECGGRGTCGKCIVGVEPAGKITDADRQHLTEEELWSSLRLACRAEPTRLTRIVLSQSQQKAKILSTSQTAFEEPLIDTGLDGQYGIALDIGTTTIVSYLLNMEQGIQTAYSAALNPQVAYGEDVMTRIDYAQQGDEARERLRRIVIDKILELIGELLSTDRIPTSRVTRMTIVGNPAMHHFLLGLDTTSLGSAPYKPVVYDSITKNANKVGFDQLTQAQVYFAPNIAGFVGGDTAAFILAQRMNETDENILGIDIGTNGEIVLSKRGKLFCCSAAAGSAFEGATISHGMRGQLGAIEHIRIADPSKPPEITVIGNEPPIGICGSGIIDLTSELLRTGKVNESGRFQDDERNYIVVKKGHLDASRQIDFTQEDIRQVQLAKGAILAGSAILLKHAGMKLPDVDTVYLAGAFGNYIDPESALRIGLLPPVEIDNILPVGNAAGEGAKKLLLSLEMRGLLERISKEIEYVELASYQNFAKIFSEATLLKSEMPF